ncbi:IS66 family insertion sequence element accessory protein TnpB [Bradyrhizobium sp. 138]|uniref:IS66 family insertion sequence element accessory protein TnpB n=1 Tax=Bradyrhizobium sp. 138 TaxID=2782615 RepID=UPI00320872A0
MGSLCRFRSDGCASVACDRVHGHAPSFPSLAEVLRNDPLSGHLFVFRGRRSDLVKLIWHDGQGACLVTKRLERRRFIWPSVAGESVTISPAQMSYLLSGIDWRNPQEAQRPTRVG